MENLVTHNIMPGKAKLWRIYDGRIISELNEARIRQTTAEFLDLGKGLQAVSTLDNWTSPGKYHHVCIYNDRKPKIYFDFDKKEPPYCYESETL